LEKLSKCVFYFQIQQKYQTNLLFFPMMGLFMVLFILFFIFWRFIYSSKIKFHFSTFWKKQL